jgi:tRNA(Ile)-lysidine synthase
LLQIPKREILAWLECCHVAFFHDPTNLDTRFLRAKMRTSIFPDLRTQFGKEFENNFCEIAREAEMLREYLNMKVAPYLQNCVKGNWGVYLDLASGPCYLYELHFLLRKVSLMQGAIFSRSQITLAAALIAERAANKKIITGMNVLECDRGRAFFMPQTIERFDGELQLKMGSQIFGNWRIWVHLWVHQEAILPKNHFVDAWRGTLQTVLPPDTYSVTFAKPHFRRAVGQDKTKELGRYLSEKKVPHFLSGMVPMICKNEIVVEDFLTGSEENAKKFSENFLAITLEYI